MEARRSSARVALALAACALLAAGGALAAPYTYPLNYVTINGTGSASGSVTFDDSLWTTGGTNGNGTVICDTSGIISFSLTVTGLTVSPYTTSFTKADLTGWSFRPAGGREIIDLNFFMGSPCGSSSNADGFVIRGVDPLSLEIYAPTGAPLAEFFLQQLSIPALSQWGLAALAALLAAAGALALRRFA